MLILLLSLFYLLLHFSAYALWFRHRPAFRTERGILFLHLASAVALPLAVFAFSLGAGATTALLCGLTVAAAHGIYSLTFLEAWALAEGSYSLPILRAIEARGSVGIEQLILDLAALGDRKKAKRVESLLRLRLVYEARGVLMLTHRGRWVAASFKALRRLANLSGTG